MSAAAPRITTTPPQISAPNKSVAPSTVPILPEARRNLELKTRAIQGARFEQPKVLTTLDREFQQAHSGNAVSVFEAEVAKLKANCHNALEREAAKERAAGRLDSAQALHAEMYLLQMMKPVPSTDEVNGNDVVHNLRHIYRGAHAKLEADRLANLRTLAAPCLARLKTMEAAYTQQGAASDAKLVRDYTAYVEAAQSGKPATPPVMPNLVQVVPSLEAAPRIPANVQPPAGSGLRVASDGTHAYLNSLGMKFVAVNGTDVLFCIHETRRAGYAAYAEAEHPADAAWTSATYGGMPAGGQDEHPVVAVNRQEAQAFCNWLTKQDGRKHRLPTDQELSTAAGVDQAELRLNSSTPETLHEREQTLYPWGGSYPPRTQDRAGNYPDTTYHKALLGQPPGIENYTEGFATTAPVMSFAPNKNGLYDMGGNAWEWVEAW